MHILTLENVVDASHGLFAGDEKQTVDQICHAIERLQSKLADMVAEKLDVQHMATDYGLCGYSSVFGPSFDNQDCPEALAAHDDSDWARGNAVRTPKAMVVLYRRSDAPNSELLAFRGVFQTEQLAQCACARRSQFPISIVGVYQTKSIREAFAAWRESRLADPDAVDSVMVEPAQNELMEMPFFIADQRTDGGAEGVFSILPVGISAAFKGYTDNASKDDSGEVVLLTRESGKLMLTVFADVNQEEPTHRISLEDARNENRQIFPALAEGAH